MRYNDVAKTIHSEMKNGPVYIHVLHSVCENNKTTATDTQQWLSYRTLADIHIHTRTHNTSVLHAQSTHALSQLTCLVILSCQSSPVSVQQLRHHSPPDSSVCGCAPWRRDCHPVSYQWKVRETDRNTTLGG